MSQSYESSLAHSITKQVHEHYLPQLLQHDAHEQANTTKQEVAIRNRLFNIDGFGVAYYSTTAAWFNGTQSATESHGIPDDDQARPVLYKNAFPPEHDPNFAAMCASTASKAVFAHIRAATATPVTAVNNHPFVFGRHTIMHNGVVSNFAAIKRELTQRIDYHTFAHIKGGTDSEHLAALYMTCLTRASSDRTSKIGSAAWQESFTTIEMRDALKETIGIVVELQQQLFGKDGKSPRHNQGADSFNPSALGIKSEGANSLNIAVTDGSQLVAVRVRNHASEQPPSLYMTETAGVLLNRKYAISSEGLDATKSATGTLNPRHHGKHTIVASEPNTFGKGEWTLINKNACVLVERDGTARVEDLCLPEEWNTTVGGLDHF